eukprot:g8475.t1
MLANIPEQDLPAYRAMGLAAELYDDGDIDASISQYRRAIELKHDLSSAWVNLGVGLSRLGRDEEAKDAYEVVGKLPNALPADAATAFCNHGHIVQTLAGADYVLIEQGNSLFRRAHASPDADQRLLTISSFMLGQLYRHGLGNVRMAVEYYKRAYDTDNTYKDALCSVLQALRSLCLWEGWESLEPRVASAIMGDVSSGMEPGPQSPYETRLTGELKPSQHLGLARLASRQYDRVSRLPLPEETNQLSFRRTMPNIGRRGHQQLQEQKQQQPFGAEAVGEFGSSARFDEWFDWQGIDLGKGKAALARKESLEGGGLMGTISGGLSVAYWSYDYRDHAMGHLTKGLLCSHQVHDRVFVVAASYGPDDKSPVRRSAESCAGKFLDVSSAGHSEAAKAVAAERPQIFVDLMAHTTGARPDTLALKPAPIVASYLGYPGTVGAEHTDYTIADSTVVPPELANVGFSEKMVFLPHSYQVNSYNVSYGSSRGLGDFLDSWGGEGPVLCNYNSIHKMEPESFTVFMNIVKRVPGSVLLLLAPSRDPDNDPELNIKAEAAARGVHPDRIRLDEMLSLEDHVWRVSGSCDLFVDSFVYGAHTTAADALWAGLPLLTLRGYGVDDTPVGQMSGRVGTSLLSALGLPELSFHTAKEMEDAAVALVQSPEKLATLRRRQDTFIGPTQGELRPLQLKLDEPRADPRIGGGTSKSPSEDSGQVGRGGGHTMVNGMVSRAAEEGLTWAETRTQEGAEAALAVSGRLLAENPLSVEALHLRGVALHLLGRQTEAIVVFERAALLASSMKHEQPDLNLDLLWGNVDAVQQVADEGGQRFSPVPALLKALVANPSQPTPLLFLLRMHLRNGDYATCAGDFWKHWANMRGYRSHPPGSRGRAAGSSSEQQGYGGQEESMNPPEGFGDVWAWDAWRGRDATVAAKVAHVAAECFGELGRLQETWRAWKLAADLDSGKANNIPTIKFSMPTKKPIFGMRRASTRPAIGKRLTTSFAGLSRGSIMRGFTSKGGRPFPKSHARGLALTVGQPPPKVIAFYCFEYGNAWFPNWGPSYLDLGLGGSEEAVVHLSRKLADLGFWVEVYADPKEQDVGRDHGFGRGAGGVVWYSYKAYDTSYPPDVFVAWRYHVSLPLAEGSGRRILWLQVYYGFSANFLEWGKDNITNFDQWMADMKRLLIQKGVIYKGMVDHNTLHDAYARAGFVLYPTAFPGG